MKINNILSFFAPKEVKFFQLLAASAEIMDKSSVLLYALFDTDDKTRIKELCRLIKLEESGGDKVTNKIFKALNETFITPFDREDITALADDMDDVTDVINRAAQNVLLFSPETLLPATAQMAGIIRKGAVEINAAVGELSNLRKSNRQIRTHIKEIKRLEEEADAVYEKCISGLFQSNMPTTELIKMKEIIQSLEKAVNKMNTVGKILKTIVIKYS
jgi:predicted phosphate transport protein (TIGR00153 family)